MTELCDLPATTLRQMIGNKRVSPVEILDSCIARIEATNPVLNAFILLCLEEARRDAAEVRLARDQMVLERGRRPGFRLEVRRQFLFFE